MKKLKTLQFMKEVIDYKSFIPVEEADMIYIDYGTSRMDLESAYKSSREIAKIFDTKVLFHFNGCDILVNEKTKMKKVMKQYNKGHEINYSMYVENEFSKAIKNLNIKNVKRKTKEVLRLIEDETGFKKYISDYQMNRLSDALTTLYKSTFDDPYLDGMVEEAKILKKSKV